MFVMRCGSLMLIAFVILVIAVALCSGHLCNHIPPPQSEVTYKVRLERGESERVIRKRSISAALRISTSYDRSLRSLPVVSQKTLTEEVFPHVIDYWQRTLKVRDTSGIIYIQRRCLGNKVVREEQEDGSVRISCLEGCEDVTYCGEVIVPPEHLDRCATWNAYAGGAAGVRGEGVRGAHVVLYVSVRDTDRCASDNTLAYAAYCQLEHVLDRPIAGFINICPHAKMGSRQEIDKLKMSISHEVLHALGFSNGLFAFYRDEYGDPLTPPVANGMPFYDTMNKMYVHSERVARSFVRADWSVMSGTVKRTVTVVVTPNVVREVRNHFNCPSLEGAELEDQGGRGTRMTHWEKRVFQDELMTGTVTMRPVISRITLAMLEDTGWYKVNYENAEEFLWGKNLGCDFVNKSCFQWITNKMSRGHSPHPFCTSTRQPGTQTVCTEDRTAVALCNVAHYAVHELPIYFQHLQSIAGRKHPLSSYAGSVRLADYCPFEMPFEWKSENGNVRSTVCEYEENSNDDEVNYIREYHGNMSLCLRHGAPWVVQHCASSQAVHTWGSGCYKVGCVEGVGVTVQVGTQTFRCHHEGQVLVVRTASRLWLHSGSVVCPPCSEVCAKRRGFRCPPDEPPPSPGVNGVDTAPVPCVYGSKVNGVDRSPRPGFALLLATALCCASRATT